MSKSWFHNLPPYLYRCACTHRHARTHTHTNAHTHVELQQLFDYHAAVNSTEHSLLVDNVVTPCIDTMVDFDSYCFYSKKTPEKNKKNPHR